MRESFFKESGTLQPYPCIPILVIITSSYPLYNVEQQGAARDCATIRPSNTILNVYEQLLLS